MNTTAPSIPSVASTRQSVAALTAFIMAHGLPATARAASLNAGEAAQAASTAAVPLPEVVVDAQRDRDVASPKFTEPLRDTPQTIVVIPKDVFMQQGATTLSDALRNTPGITFAAGEGGSAASTAGDSFYLRGFDTTNNIFVDGVRDVGAYSRDVFNFEQVEVAKGPAGSDVGRGAASGYVNIATKVPHEEDFAAGTLSYGVDDATSGSRRRATLDTNRSLPNSPIKGAAVRVNAMWQDSAVVGRDVAANKSWALAPSLALGLGTPTRATLAYQHGKQDNLPDYGLPTPAFPGYASTPPPPAIDPTTFYGFTSDYDRVTTDAVTARVEHEVAPATQVSNQTRYSAVSRDAIVTGPGSNIASYVPATGLLSRTRQANKRDTSILSNQTNVVAKFLTGALVHDFTGGVELSREKAYTPAFTTVTLVAIPVAQPDPNAVPSGTPVRSGAYTNVKVDTAAAYVFDTVKFSKHWQLNGSLRLERYTTDFDSVAVGNIHTPGSAGNDLASWKTGLVFKPVAAGSFYLAYGISLTPPGTDFTVSTVAGNQNNLDTDPQRTASGEAGVKWAFFHDRLTTTAAIFKTSNDKTVFTDPVLGAIPAGRQTVQGVELNASGKVTDHWLVFAGFAYLDSMIDAGATAGNNPSGAQLPLTPRLSGNFWNTYRLPFGVTIGGGTQYVGDVNRRDATTTVPRTMPAYWLFNALASYDVSRRLSLRLNVNNVFGREYVQSYNNNGARFNPGAPRAYLLTANLKF